jgi:Purple acid Phosphatase, N-terminal domain
MRDVGSNGGGAAMFAYDLARSVVYTRQGNPAWAGQNRDGLTPNRSNDMFFGGGGQPDWIDLNKVQIPQADEQQRLLANMIIRMSRDRIPLPRFWYFPRDLEAVVIMTGDDHARGGTIGRFNDFNAASPANCNVAQWECVRGTSYIYPNTPITDQQAAAFNAQGHEIALHPTTGCTDYTQSSLNSVFATQLADLAASFPSLPDPTTNRTHCIVWSDWSTQATVSLAHGIRLDTNYYYYPGSWVANRPGMFTGSGMPMRFAAMDGSMIDVYQATSQLTDESGQQYPFTVDTLLDNAIGPNGYYGAFTINAHTDLPTIQESVATVESAQERGVPVITARQMLTWLDGRNGSAFRSLNYNAGTLSFTIDAGAGATGLRAMLPTDAAGGPLTTIRRAGNPISYTTETIKGIQYAVFPATAGAYTATYQGDTTPPTISSVNATSATDGTATITWTTNEASDSRVDYGTAPNALNSQASNANMTQNHTVTLTGLTPATTYHFRVTSRDAANNSATSPSTPNPPATFTTPNQTFRDTTTQDFTAGTAGAGAYLSQRANGEVILTPTVGQEFSGTTLPTGWFSTNWSGGGSATVANGTLSVNGARSGTSALFGSGRSIEFSATYSGVPWQYGGFGVTFNEAPWILVGAKNDSNLYARTNNGTQTDTSAGSGWVGTPQRIRIEWNGNSIVYYRNGTQFASHPVSIATQLRALFSDFTVGGGAVTVDWVHMSPYASSGTFTSRVFDAGGNVTWTSAPWTSTTPTGTSVGLSVRTGNTPTPDASWSNWQQLSGPNAPINTQARYIQYQANLSTTDLTKTPELNEVELRFNP